MKASWEKKENNTGILTVEVEVEKVTAALDQAFKKVVGKVNVPGFRKGKVPRQIFEAKFGVESLYQDAIDIILPPAYTEAVQQTGIQPIDRPEIDDLDFAKGQEFKFTAKVQVRPEVELGQYKGVEVPERDFSVTAEDIEAELKRMQERHAELVVIEEDPAEEGDTVIIDFDGYMDGEPFEGGQAERHTLELGSNSFIPGFEEQVVGMVKDEDKDIEVTFPEDYHAEELQGKQAVFKVKLHEIKRKNLPPLDDEFAMDVSEFETFEEYKQDLEKTMNEAKERERESYIQSTALSLAAQSATVEIPEVMIKDEVDQMLQNFGEQLRRQGMNLEMYTQFSGQSEEALKEQMLPDARTRVLESLVLEAVAKAEELTATEEEITEELEHLSKHFGQSVDELKELFTSNGVLDNITADVVSRKALKFLAEHSKLVPAEAEEVESAEATDETEKKEEK